jgi:hypothetical protein
MLRPANSSANDFTSLIAPHEDWGENRLFVKGDHWQDGDGWPGTFPAEEKQGKDYMEAKKRIKSSFISQNAVKEVVRRHMSGVIGREPSWELVPMGRDEAEEGVADRAHRLLRDWLRRRDGLNALQKATERALWGEDGPLRLFVPQGRLQGNEELSVPANLGVEDAMDLLFVESVPANRCTVHTIRSHMKPVGIYRSVDDDAESAVEVSYLDDENRTVLRLLEEGGDEMTVAPINMGGYLTHHNLSLEPIITPQVRQQQRFLNKSHTMKNVNLDWSGFLERIYLNAQEPGHYEDDEGNIYGEGGPGRHWVNEGHDVGHGTVQHLAGVVTQDRDGGETVARPEVVFRHPEPTDLFDQAIQGAYTTILKECGQVHAAQGWSADASGEAIRQHMADYIVMLYLSRPAVERAAEWMMYGVLRLASALAGEAGKYDGYRLSVEARLNPGPVPAQEIEAIVSLVKNKLMSHPTGMERAGIEDADAEMDRLRADLYSQLDVDVQRSELAGNFSQAGMPLVNALKAAGFDDNRAEELASFSTNPPEP